MSAEKLTRNQRENRYNNRRSGVTHLAMLQILKEEAKKRSPLCYVLGPVKSRTDRGCKDMRIDLRQWGITVLLLALSFWAFPAQQTEPRYDGLPNFHRVNEHLFRGGQPKRDGLKKLSELGIKTILNLRGESEETNGEEAEAKKLGMHYFNLPMSNLGRPTDEQVSRALAILDDPENGPVFVHCKLGADRTGAIIAVYRIKHDGWTAEQAMEEANRCGMGRIQFRKRGYISDYYKQHGQQPRGGQK